MVAITDDTGTLTSQQRYLPFGGARTNIDDSPVTQTDYGYTGQRDLGDMGLMDYKARLYSPMLGRFVQPDTIVPDVLNTQAWNRYSYVSIILFAIMIHLDMRGVIVEIVVATNAEFT